MPFESQPELQASQPNQNRALEAASERLNLMDVWRVIVKQRLTILVVTVLFVAVAAFHVFRTKPVYESVARIEIKPNNPPDIGLQHIYLSFLH